MLPGPRGRGRHRGHRRRRAGGTARASGQPCPRRPAATRPHPAGGAGLPPARRCRAARAGLEPARHRQRARRVPSCRTDRGRCCSSIHRRISARSRRMRRPNFTVGTRRPAIIRRTYRSATPRSVARVVMSMSPGNPGCSSSATSSRLGSRAVGRDLEVPTSTAAAPSHPRVTTLVIHRVGFRFQQLRRHRARHFRSSPL